MPMSNPAPSEILLTVARRHRKVINYYIWMLDRLTMPAAERSAIQMRIAEEECALAEIGRLAGLPLVAPAQRSSAPAPKEEERAS
jgi:hypothetical protein